VNITLYVEGGGDSNALRTECRKAFSKFFEEAGLSGRMPKVVACGSRREAFDDSRTGLRAAGKGDYPVLLVDSEGPVRGGAWEHLKNRPGDEWDRPDGAMDDQAHLMVQLMETWFLADRDVLAEHFGQAFNANALPANPELEEIPKDDVLDGLKQATHPCGRNRRYAKGKCSFRLLARMDPVQVVQACPHARQLTETLNLRAGT